MKEQHENDNATSAHDPPAPTGQLPYKGIHITGVPEITEMSVI